MEQYFITLQAFTLEEYEIWKQLNKYSDFNTNVAGYTVNQLVVNSDKRLNLTTQKVRTILKKFEKEGYIEFVSSGSMGKESTLKLMLKEKLFSNQQQCNNNLTNKSEQLQSVEQVEQQQSNNNVTTLSKDKRKNNIYSDNSKEIQISKYLFKLILKNNPKAKKIICVETGEVFDCIKFAIEKYSIKDHTNMAPALKYPVRTAGGYHWVSYKDEFLDDDYRLNYLIDVCLLNTKVIPTTPIIA